MSKRASPLPPPGYAPLKTWAQIQADRLHMTVHQVLYRLSYSRFFEDVRVVYLRLPEA
jgi:hypothetical protein